MSSLGHFLLDLSPVSPPPRRWSGFFYPPDTNFDFPTSDQGQWFSPLPSACFTTVPAEGPQHQPGKGAAGGRGGLLPPWKQPKGGLVCACSSPPSLLRSGLCCLGAKPLHPLLENMPTLVAVLHPEDCEPSSPPAFPQGKSRALYGNVSF